jgi:hypothetical protein
VAIGHLNRQPFTAPSPSAQRRHVGLDPGLIDEDKARGINQPLVMSPLAAPSGVLAIGDLAHIDLDAIAGYGAAIIVCVGQTPTRLGTAFLHNN